MRYAWAWIRSYTAPAWIWAVRCKPRPLKQGNLQTWYGRVNCWASGGKDTLRKDLIACAANGVSGYLIEMAGWAETSGYRLQWGDDKRMKEIEALYAFLVAQCRALGLWCFVSIVNDNAGSGKYGDSGIYLRQVRGEVTRLIACVRKEGKKNVLVQPVAETQTRAGDQIQSEVIATLHGFTFVTNDDSRPSRTPGWAKYRAWHPFSIDDDVPGDALAVSDTGRIILQLGAGYDGKAHPDTLKGWCHKMRILGCPVAGYYAFKRKDHDSGAIKALGEAGKG